MNTDKDYGSLREQGVRVEGATLVDAARDFYIAQDVARALDGWDFRNARREFPMPDAIRDRAEQTAVLCAVRLWNDLMAPIPAVSVVEEG